VSSVNKERKTWFRKTYCCIKRHRNSVAASNSSNYIQAVQKLGTPPALCIKSLKIYNAALREKIINPKYALWGKIYTKRRYKISRR